MSYVAAALGFLPGGLPVSQALGCSANGDVVVGIAADATNQRAVWWDASHVIHLLSEPPGHLPGAFTFAAACSADGTLIVGQVGDGLSPAVAVSWLNEAPGILPSPGFSEAIATGCSADGNRICGGVTNGLGFLSQPCVWIGGAFSLLPLSLGAAGGVAYGFSSDGTCIVGLVLDGLSVPTPVIWTGGPSWSINFLGALPGGVPGGGDAARACSSTGAVSVGLTGNAGSDSVPVFWNPTTANAFAGPFGGVGAIAQSCDGTGALVGGADPGGIATLWTSGAGANLPNFSGALSVNLAAGISTDGSAIVGWGVNADAHVTAVKWVWVSGAVASLNLDNVVVTSLTTESPCTVAQYTTPPSVSPAVGLRWSDTRGQTFGNAVAQALSDDPLSQLQWNRTGYARGRVFELFWSAAKKTALNGAFVEIEPWKS